LKNIGIIIVRSHWNDTLFLYKGTAENWKSRSYFLMFHFLLQTELCCSRPKQFAARAQKIYSEYVTAHAPREVGVLGLFFNSTEPGLCWSAGFWQDYIMYKEHIYFQIFYVGLLKGNSCFQLN